MREIFVYHACFREKVIFQVIYNVTTINRWIKIGRKDPRYGSMLKQRTWDGGSIPAPKQNKTEGIICNGFVEP